MGMLMEDGIPDISVELGSIALKNPIMVASGTFGFGDEGLALLDKSDLGAFVTKTITRNAREGNPPPRIAETPCGMLNSIGLENPGVKEFARETLPSLLNLAVPIVVSIGGEQREDYVYVAETIASSAAVCALELNISCPNIGRGGMPFAEDASQVEQLVSAVKKTVQVPLWVKLSPNVTAIADTARAGLNGGAEALVVGNTFKGMAVDIQTRRSKLNRNIAGLSGPAIRPLALAKVWEVVHTTGAPVIASGGVFCVDDAIEFFIVGAGAVQLGTVNFIEPGIHQRMVGGIREYCAREGIERLEDLIGTLESS
jgi:dihydroorotate dehydrogenase (NAD+) catalytic subunit